MRKMLFVAFAAIFVFENCEIKQTEKGELPKVRVNAEEGKLPKFDVDWAKVNVGTTTRIVKVPKVVVVMEEQEIKVPYVDVDMPSDSGSVNTSPRQKEERTLTVEAEVSGQTQDLKIQEVYATENRLYVIAELEPTGQDLQKETMRVSDRVVVNVPDDMDVKYYIIGKRPSGLFNLQYRYIDSRAAIADKLQGGKVIYSRT
jgi:hypothetical protein